MIPIHTNVISTIKILEKSNFIGNVYSEYIQLSNILNILYFFETLIFLVPNSVNFIRHLKFRL